MRLLLLVLLFTGITLIVVNELINKPEQIVTYKYLPRDLDTYLREEPYASVTFADMFSEDFAPTNMYSSTLGNTAVATGFSSNAFALPALPSSNVASASATLPASAMGVYSPHLATSSVIF